MGIKVLDERHKMLAEEMLKGTPRAKIAEKIGVDRSTLYVWMQDPLWQEYFEKLAGDLDEARSMRLRVTFMKMAEVTEEYLDHVLEELRTKDPDRIARVPGLDTISTALKRIGEMERTDAGLPSRITREEKGDADATPEAEKRGRRTKRLLDEIVTNREETQH